MRKRTKINENWKFCRQQWGDDSSIPAGGWEFPSNSTCTGEEMSDIQLPHDWRIDGPFNPDNSYRFSKIGGHLELRDNSALPFGIAWYRRSLKLDTSLEGQRIYLEFEGVQSQSTVWINGVIVGKNEFGYNGFVLDITHFVKFGDEPNIISVKAAIWEPEGWWYDGGGIYRDVWLIITDPIHVDNWGTFVTTPEIDEKRALVQVGTELRNTTKSVAKCTLRSDIMDRESKLIASVSQEVSLAANTVTEVTQKMEVLQPDLWSPSNPSLYKMISTVIINGNTTDVYETPFGMRWFHFDSQKGFFINGKSLHIRGCCIHHDFGGLGAGLPPRAHEKSVEVLKDMGSNIIRSAHNEAAPALMDICDREGLLFWGETRYQTLQPLSDTVPALESMIKRDRNHPSIILWCLGNTAGHIDGTVTDLIKVLNDAAHAADPSRPTAIALEYNADANANGLAFATDIVGYNGCGMGKDDGDHENYPERKMIISEYGANYGVRGVYELQPNKGSCSIDDEDLWNKMRGGRYLIQNQCKQHEGNWKHIMDRPWLGGGIIWVGIDHLAEAIGWPCISSQLGLFDTCRFPKDTAYFYKQEWTEEPMVHLFPHWTWPDRDGQSIEMWCYSNCDEVELFLNGTSLGTKPSVPSGHISWDVPYEPGEILAKASKNGSVVCETKIRTAGAPTQLTADADRTVISADGEDLTFIKVSAHDADGTLCPEADNSIRFSVEGPGVLLGMSNGDPCCHELPRGEQMPLFNGMMLATVQHRGKSGTIRITATTENLKTASIEVTAG